MMLLNLIDFGLVVLIWMTQLVVYPSFCYFSDSDLLLWHRRYTTSISFLVIPLMLAQLFSHGIGLWQHFSLPRLLAAILIGLIWVNTFGYAVPLHNKISAGADIASSAKRLVAVNWYRTVLWTVVFLLGVFFFHPERSSGDA